MDAIATLKDFITKEVLEGRTAGAIDTHTNLLQLGLIDSMALLQLVDFVEESFGIQIAPKEIGPENFASIGAIVQFIDRKKR